MQVSVETTQGLERRMTVTVPKAQIDSEVEKRLKSLAGQVKVQGFRPGKAPFNVIRQKYTAGVLHEVRGDVIQSSFFEALTEKKLRPAGKPYIKAGDATGGDLEFTATFEVYPEFELKGLDKLKIERPVADVTEADVEKMVETLRKRQVEWKEVERKAAIDDRVTVNFVGTIDGEEFKGGTGNNVDVVLGAKRMIPGLEEQLVGTRAGDHVDIQVTFPDNYPVKELASKPAKFATDVVKVEEPVLPQVNEEFAAKFGVSVGGIEAFKKEIRANMERELDQTIQARLKARVFDALVGLKLFELPKALVDSEIERLVEQRRQMMIQYGGSGRASGIEPANFQSEAEQRVALGLLLAEIVRKNDLKVAPERLRDTVNKLAASYQDPDAVVKHYYGDKERLEEVESMTLEEMAVEWVLQQANVKDVPTSFDDLMKPAQTAA